MIATARHVTKKGWTLALAAAGSAALGSCAAPQAAPPPPAPRPVAVRTPLPVPRPALADWRDAPQTAGDWRWSLDAGRSTASFAAAGFTPTVKLICDRGARRVLLMRTGTAAGSVPMALRTTSTLRPLPSDPALSPPGWLAVAIPARDPLLDAMAFSRGRFAVEAAGLETLYLPAWPEISRVIEDCR